MKVKTFLLAIVILICVLFSNKSIAQVDSSWATVTVTLDTVFQGIDSSYITIGVDMVDGRIAVYPLTRVDSVWAIKQTGGLLLMQTVPNIVRTHYYLPDGNRVWINQDVWIMNKIRLTAN